MSLTDYQRKEVESLFKFLDKNEDGKLSGTEAAYGLQILGKKLLLKEINDIKSTEEYDLNDFSDLCSTKVDFTSTESEMIRAFKILENSAKPGYFHTRDLTHLLKLFNKRITEKDINEIIKEAHPDNDYIELDTFAKEILVH